ncbi:hypothetical protein JZ751_018761 [Albula glossodonta]|uniref:Uncharacterized protein n=1 Tax=Albula glossodonta TaxID=121402 RepID=A0A8T2NZ89_9TELE|nr:hypothetical protein JZ751_018761 [Albula glossodonta]
MPQLRLCRMRRFPSLCCTLKHRYHHTHPPQLPYAQVQDQQDQGKREPTPPLAGQQANSSRRKIIAEREIVSEGCEGARREIGVLS